MPRITVKYTNKTLKLVNTLYLNRIIQGYIIDTANKAKYITFNPHYYRGIPYFSHFKVVSTPSKPQTISSKALSISTKSIGKSLIILETDKGIITHTEAIKYNIGGRVLGVIS
jgi:ribosomal protein S8